MYKLTETAYWMFAAGAASSVALSLYVLIRVHISGDSPLNITWGPLSLFDISFGFMMATMIFGILVVMPALRHSTAVQEKLTGRAAKLERDAVTDPLTGLFNRRYFEDALKEYLNEFNRIDAPLALMSLDMDHFKSVNDSYGHDAGDVVLRQLAKRLKELTREHDIVARTGGEEFCIIAPFAKAEQIRPLAERICRSVGEMRVDLGNVILRPTVSIGVASTIDGVRTAKGLLKLSDERLYLAKETGRNRVCA